MKFYDFIDKAPAIGRLVVVEGTQRALADRALEVLLDRLLPESVRELNLVRFSPEEAAESARVAEAAGAMPFLADCRVVVVSEAQTMRVPARRALWEVAQAVPEGNTLVLIDLLAPRAAAKGPEPFGVLAGRAALRIDTTANDEVRARFVEETLERLGATAQASVVDELVRGGADLAAVRNDLEKLALGGRRITLQDIEREAISVADPKAYRYAGLLTEGKLAQALAIAHELFADDPRGAAVKLLSPLAYELESIWELTWPGAVLPKRLAYRERYLRPAAARIGRGRARAAFERVVDGVAAVVTGRAGSDPEDLRNFVDRTSVEIARTIHPRTARSRSTP